MRNLKSLNWALLCKWSWLFVVEREALWRKISCEKYGDEEVRWRSLWVKGRHGVCLWKAMRKEWDLLGNRAAFFVGSERRVKFWVDKWCGDKLFRVSFPSIFNIATLKYA